MRIIYTLILISYSLLANAQWEYRGLISTQTTHLTISNDTIYASTYDGIYKQPLNIASSDTNWIACGMQGRHVVQTFVPDPQTFICLVEIGSTFQTQIYKSIDGGQNFNLLTTDTSVVNPYPFLNAMAHYGDGYDTLFFLNHHLKTLDGGLTWNTINPVRMGDRFITFDKHSNYLFIGGETMILSPYLQISNDLGDTWVFTPMNGYFAGDNSVHDIDFDVNDYWYAAGEGVLCETMNMGTNWLQRSNTWSYPPNFSLYNYDIECGFYGVYVTGSNSNAMNVPCMFMRWGTGFYDTLSTPTVDGQNAEMRCLTVNKVPGAEYVYFGGHGIYLYAVTQTAIDEKDRNEITVYPNPSADLLNVRCNSADNDHKLLIYDSVGRNVLQQNISKGQSMIDVSQLSIGVYYILIVDSNGSVLKRFKNIKL